MIFLTFFTAFCFDHYNCCSIAYTQHKPDFVSCMRLLHQTHTYSVCSVYTVHVHSISRLYMLSHRSPLPVAVYDKHNIYPLFDFKSKHCFLKCSFSIVILFLHCTLYSLYLDFLDVFKRNKYKNTLFNAFYF